MAIAIGEAAPRFTLPKEDGEQVSLPASETPTVLVFYRGDW